MEKTSEYTPGQRVDDMIEDRAWLEQQAEKDPSVEEKARKYIAEINERLDALFELIKSGPKIPVEQLDDKATSPTKIQASKLGQQATGMVFTDSQGFVHNNVENARGSEPDNWRIAK